MLLENKLTSVVLPAKACKALYLQKTSDNWLLYKNNVLKMSDILMQFSSFTFNLISKPTKL